MTEDESRLIYYCKLLKSAQFPWSRVRLFLSVDIASSTPFKQSISSLSLSIPRPASEAAASSEGGDIGRLGDLGSHFWATPFFSVYAQFDSILESIWQTWLAEEDQADRETRAFPDIAVLKPFLSAQKKNLPTFDQWVKAGNQHGEIHIGTDVRQAVDHRPKFWKALGDELVYQMKIENPFQALAAVLVWQQAVICLRRAAFAGSTMLDLKAAAWIAEFPVGNTEVVTGDLAKRYQVLPPGGTEEANMALRALAARVDQGAAETNGPAYLGLDFIGPQMDVGFRLAKLATPRRMIIAPDLAYVMLASLLCDTEASLWEKTSFFSGTEDIVRQTAFMKWQEAVPRVRDSLSLGFVGLNVLVGVTGGVPFPSIWLDTGGNDLLAKAEDKLYRRKAIEGVQQVENMINLMSYCYAFLAKAEINSFLYNWLSLPFFQDFLLREPNITRLFGGEVAEDSSWVLEPSPKHYDATAKKMRESLANNVTVLESFIYSINRKEEPSGPPDAAAASDQNIVQSERLSRAFRLIEDMAANDPGKVATEDKPKKEAGEEID